MMRIRFLSLSTILIAAAGCGGDNTSSSDMAAATDSNQASRDDGTAASPGATPAPGTPVLPPDFGTEPGVVPVDPGAVTMEPAAAPNPPGANTNVSLGGSQDFGFFRRQLDEGRVPEIGSFDAAGFFAEHHTTLPSPDCGDRVCLQAMLGVMSNLLDGANCTMLQLGLNSPIAADPDQRPPLSLAVVVDTSGSMRQDGKMDFVRDGLELLIDGLTDDDRFALITYDNTSTTTMAMTDVRGNRVEMRSAVQALQADGGTNLYDGLQTGYREVFANYDSARQNRVILLSDGNPTIGITGDGAISDMSEAFNSEGVGLTTIGLGSDFNINLMRDLALRADGNFYFLENAGAVSEVFDEELSFFTVPVAFDLKLEVTSGSDYEFGRAIGSPLWQDTPTGGILEVPSVFIAHRESADDVTDDGGRRGGGSALLVELMPRLLSSDGSEQTSADVATIDVQFREPGSDELVQDQIIVNYPHPPWELLPEGFFTNIDSASEDLSVVTKSFLMLNIFAGMEIAVAAFHENNRDASESITMLENLLAALEDYNEEVEDTDIDFDMALIRQLIDVLIQNDVQPPPPTPIVENPWPRD